MRSIRSGTAAAIAAVALLLIQDPAAFAQAPREEFSATISNISNVGAAGIAPVTIRIHSWTSDEDHERLMSVLREKGQNAFLRDLLNQDPVGSIAPPTSLKYDFFYGRQEATKEGGRKIFLITDRPMDVSERLYATRSRDYPFTVLEMTLDQDGRGQGTVSQLAQLRLLGNFLGIENLATAPMKLSDVKKVK